MIRTEGLTKKFGSFTAVEDLDLEVAEGEVYGFLGANGSGKTTTVRMLLGLVLATSGSVEIFGQQMPKHAGAVLPEIGALVEGPAAYGHLHGRANLAVLDASGPRGGRRSRKRRIEDVLDKVGLGGIDRRPVRTYSLGMRQRLGLAAALLNEPRLLVLDEPTNGLDPQGIREIRDLINELHAAGTTIMMLSHQLAEVEQVCGRVGVLDRGRLVLQQDLAELRKPTGRFVVTTPDVAQVRTILGQRVEGDVPGGLLVAATDAAELNRALVSAGVRVQGLVAEQRRLEDLVLAATSAGADRIDR
ncbi:MAG: transporter related protein [Marmoricola sp.]|nr:transporter related protein [Marmoricola sp.]